MTGKYFITRIGIFEVPQPDQLQPDKNQVLAAERVIEAMKKELGNDCMNKNANGKYSSYSYKHLFENNIYYRNNTAYCSNGSAILSLVNKGFKIGKRDGLNCTFNLSAMAIKWLQNNRKQSNSNAGIPLILTYK